MTKNIAVVLASLAFVLPGSVNAWSDYGYNPGYSSGNFFFPYGTGYGAPREELIVYAWGPGVTQQSPYNNYNQPTYYQQPMYQPNYYQPQTYYQPYYPQQQYYYEPQYYYDQQPYFGYSAQPTGQTDFWGNQLCNWGDYRGYSCDQDPHQWIQDTYTGEWY